MKNLYLISLLFAINILFGCFKTQAQTSITGSVSDSISGEPLSYATIQVFTMDSTFLTGSLTNDEGVFEIDPIENGEYILVVGYIGYSEFSIAVKITAEIAGAKTPTK